jgi:hypothetical protein
VFDTSRKEYHWDAGNWRGSVIEIGKYRGIDADGSSNPVLSGCCCTHGNERL